MASKDEAKMIGWPQQSSYMPLWLLGELDKGIAPKDEILTPSYFKLDSLKNKGYNADEDATRVATYVDRLKSQYGASGSDSTSSYEGSGNDGSSSVHSTGSPSSEGGQQVTAGSGNKQVKFTVKRLSNYTDITIQKDGLYNGMKKYEGYTAINRSLNTLQAKINYSPKVSTDKKGFRKTDGRYLIAVGTRVSGTTGTYVDVFLKNGTKIECIVGDIKSDAHTDASHIFTAVNANWCCSEFIVDPNSLESTVKGMGDCSYAYPSWKSPVVAFRVYKKSWFD